MASLQLQDKVILITGCLGAAGHAAVKLFLERGALIAACDIKPEETFADAEELRRQYGSERLTYMRADMTQEDQVKRFVAQIEKDFGRLEGSYHTTYVNNCESIAKQSLESWEESIRGTLTSTFLVSKYAAALMMKSQGGSIVNISSVLGSIPKANNAAYGAGKAGIEQLTRVLAVEYAGYGIRANTVAPGDFKSEAVLANASEEHVKTMAGITLMGRSGFPNEINEVAAFLLSDGASYVTGSVYPVTGGIWLSPDRRLV
jgi:NAD(P)-dependent dehydrogenase (short-subunit alcohol dehydrogenase family)